MPTLALAKQHLRVETDDEDALIGTYLAAAVRWVENFTGTKLTRGSVTQEEAGFATYIGLNWGPSPDALTVAYVDASGAGQTVTDARLVRDRAYAPLAGWPVADDYSPITLTYTAGWDEVPEILDAAVLLYTRALYDELRTGADPTPVLRTIENMCSPYRQVMV